MNKALKIILWLVGGIVALVLIAAIVLPMVLDPNDFRDEIGAAVRKQTGRDLQIEGDLELSVIPWLGVRVGPARLANAEGFGDEPMLAIEGAAVGVKLFPLLSKRLEVSRVELDGLRLQLLRRADGVSNWDDLTTAEAPAEPPPAAESAAFDLGEIAGIGVNDAAVVYEDRVAGESYRVSLVELGTGRITGLNATPVVDGLELSDAKVSYEGGDKGRFAVELKSFSAAALGGDADTIDVRDVALADAKVDYEDPTGKLRAVLGRLETDGVSGSTAAPRVAGVTLADADLSWDGGEDGRLKALIERLESGAIAADPERPDIDGLKLSGVDFDYDGGAAGKAKGKLGRLEAGRIAANPEAPEIGGLKLSGLSFDYDGGQDGKAKGTLASLETGRIVADPEAPVVEGVTLADAEVDYDAGAEATYRALVSELRLGNLSGGTPVPVNLKATARTGAPETSLDLDLKAQAALAGSALTVTALDAGLGLSGEQIPGGKQSGSLRADRLGYDNGSGEFSVGGLALAFVGLDVTGELAGSQTDAGPRAAGNLTVAEFSPRALMEKVGAEVPETADPAVLTRASLRSDIALDGELLRLDGLKATLDDTTLNGKLDVTTGRKLVLNTTLDLDAIDLDRYLPPESDEEAPPAPTGPTEIPTEELKGMQVNATLRAGSVKAANLRLTDLVATATLKGGRLILDPLAASLYDGKLKGRLVLATGGEVPQLKLKQTLKSVAIGPLMRDLAEVDRLTGSADLELDVVAAGHDSDQMIEGLNGDVSFAVSDGALKGFNLTQALAQGVALVKGGRAPANASPNTEFKKLNGSGVIANGVLTNEDFKAVIPGVRVSGSGQVNLGRQAIDYQVVAAVQKGQKAQEAGLAELAGKSIPVRISGSLEDPSIRPELAGLIGDEVRDKVFDVLGIDKDKKKKGSKDGEEQPEEDLKDRLKNLIGG
jgi:AsmA protein